ncbi:protein kinase domain-containing protein [Paludisphaera mucosa]|uniref:non-specific serine/threonine protein kinase n=1 Tax=Paludisphaera mucosa TaxID=3030827 RepID=A0ABT6FL27_9BACT|nr:serine/threonine-protein kinase [Paludisphaera mucosa]MDG3008080.1 serine/threonine-protein kinase [Paludisphaera mucosa]
MDIPSWPAGFEGVARDAGPIPPPSTRDRPRRRTPAMRRTPTETASWIGSQADPPQRAGSGPHRRIAGPVRMPEAGEAFLGFRLVAELGRGSFARVFLANQGELADRPVVLKVACALEGETWTLARLQHTHVVPIYSVHRSERLQAFCMPYLGPTTLADVLADVAGRDEPPGSGRDLLETLQARSRARFEAAEATSREAGPASEGAAAPPPRPPQERAASGMAQVTRRMLEGMSYIEAALWILSCLADGLGHAHERGILHRDLKPANVLITDEGQPLLLDFNLSQDESTTGRPRAVGGTLPYMSPEHLDAFRGADRRVDARSDLYSLGVILYELLTGRPPFAGRAGMPAPELVARMIEDRTGPPPDPRPWNHAVSPAVASIVRHCLEPDPDRRYQTAGELREDLRRQIEHRPLRYAADASPRERLGKWARRHPRLTSPGTLAALAVTLAVALAGGLGLGAHRAGMRERAREARARFARDFDEARSALNSSGVDASRRREGIDACRRALGLGPGGGGPSRDVADPGSYLDLDARGRWTQDRGEAFWLLAQATWLEAAERGDDERAEAEVRRALAWNREAEACHPDGGVPAALWSQRAELLARLGRAGEARAFAARAAAAPPLTARDHYLAAVDHAVRGRFEAALGPLREATRLDPGLWWPWSLRGVCHDRLGQDVDALGCYQACIALRPADPWPHFNRGLVHLRRREPARALADFDEALRQAPGRPDVLLDRALALHQLGRYGEAVRDVDLALERGAGPARAVFMRARIRGDAGDAEGARRDRELGMTFRPTDEPGWIARGLARADSDPDGALEDFRQALRLDPRSLAALQNSAHVLSRTPERAEEAIRLLGRALEAFPDYVPARSGRGVLLARLGRREEALADAEGALSRDSSPATLYQLAGVYAQTSRREPGDAAAALGLLSRALRGGFGWDLVAVDPDLDPIRARPEFARWQRAASPPGPAVSPSLGKR